MSWPEFELRTSTSDSPILRKLHGVLRLIANDRTLQFSTGVFMILFFVGIFGDILAPHPPNETLYGPDGRLLRAESPSLAHPLGTTQTGQDVLSRIIIGTRPTLITGLLGGALIVVIGALIGITAGYAGGQTDGVLMRFTDFAYGVPLLPFAIVLLAFFGVGFIESIIVIGIVLWRGSARVLRSQVLQIKERPFIRAAEASGASSFRIVWRHILPNVSSMAVLFFALGIGYTIIVQAGLAFLGLTDPFTPSWGIMIRNAYNSGLMAQAWWWAIPPGILISITVLSAFLFGRKYEELASDVQDEEGFLQMG